MRALLQRVTRASVAIDSAVIGAIGPGLCILVGAGPADTPAIASDLARKCAELRIFADEAAK